VDFSNPSTISQRLLLFLKKKVKTQENELRLIKDNERNRKLAEN